MGATSRVRRRITQLRNPARTSLELHIEILKIRDVLGALIRRLRGVVGGIAVRVETALRSATRPVSIVGGLLRDIARTREELVAENMVLRKQLIIAARRMKKRKFAAHERALLVLLTRFMPLWRDAMLLVKPETILRWHREGFRLLWRVKSRPPVAAAPRIAAEAVELIRRLAVENQRWGAERIRGELLKLGVNVAKRTIQKHLRRFRGPRPWGQSWSTFLQNHMHQTWSCDFLQLYDVWFQPIFAFCEGPPFLIRDNDNKFGVDFDRAAKGADIQVIRTAVRAPLMNSFCERFLGSVRRECIDHVIVLGERHLARVLREYCFAYFNGARPHRAIGQLLPIGTVAPVFSARTSQVARTGLATLLRSEQLAETWALSVSLVA